MAGSRLTPTLGRHRGPAAAAVADMAVDMAAVTRVAVALAAGEAAEVEVDEADAVDGMGVVVDEMEDAAVAVGVVAVAGTVDVAVAAEVSSRGCPSTRPVVAVEPRSPLIDLDCNCKITMIRLEDEHSKSVDDDYVIQGPIRFVRFP